MTFRHLAIRAHDAARQVWRGSKNLPHIGPNKEIWLLIAMTSGVSMVCAIFGDWKTVLIGSPLALFVFGVDYAFKAYGRAEKHDRIIRKRRLSSLSSKWIATLPLAPNTHTRVLFAHDHHNDLYRVMMHYDGISNMVEPPEHILSHFNRILTDPIDPKQHARHPSARDLSFIDFLTRETSAHERMEAISELHEAHFPSESRRIGQP